MQDNNLQDKNISPITQLENSSITTTNKIVEMSAIMSMLAPFSNIVDAPDFLKYKKPEKVICSTDIQKMDKAEAKRKFRQEKRIAAIRD